MRNYGLLLVVGLIVCAMSAMIVNGPNTRGWFDDLRPSVRAARARDLELRADEAEYKARRKIELAELRQLKPTVTFSILQNVKVTRGEKKVKVGKKIEFRHTVTTWVTLRFEAIDPSNPARIKGTISGPPGHPFHILWAKANGDVSRLCLTDERSFAYRGNTEPFEAEWLESRDGTWLAELAPWGDGEKGRVYFTDGAVNYTKQRE